MVIARQAASADRIETRTAGEKPAARVEFA
jgi:hypothetical protein